MKRVSVIVGLLLSACGAEQVTEDIKARQAFDIYMKGNWVAHNSECSQPILNVGNGQINDGEIVCSIANVEMLLESDNENGEMIIVANGKSCTAEGNQLGDFTFSFRPLGDEIYDYKNSGETVWTKIKQCPMEEKGN